MSSLTYEGNEWYNGRVIDLTQYGNGYTQQLGGKYPFQFFGFDDEVLLHNVVGPEKLKKVFENCATVSSIITNLSEAFANGEFKVVNPDSGKDVRGDYKQWVKIFDEPNALQSRRQFLTEFYTYRKLVGYTFVYVIKPIGFDEPEIMFNIPPWMLHHEPIRKPFFNITREDILNNVWLTWNGSKVKLDPKNLMFFTDTTQTFDPQTYLPQSRVMSLKYPISILFTAEEAEITLMQKKGAIGILSNEQTASDGSSLALSEEEKQDVQNDFRRYGLTRDNWQYIISPTALSWQAMSFPTRDLMLQESWLKAAKSCADGFGYPFPLLAHSDQSTYNNIQTAGRLLYENTIIPDGDSVMEQWTRNFRRISESAKKVKFVMDYDKVPSLQQSMKDEGDGLRSMNQAFKILWDNNLTTRNKWLEKIGEDKISDPLFDKYKNQLTPEELGIIDNNNGQSGQGGSGSEQAKETTTN